MPKNAATGEDELDPTNTAGNGSEGAADPALEGLKAALKAEREKRQGVETKLARLEGTVDGLKAGHQPNTKTEPKVYSTAELRALVTKGEITEDQMLDQIRLQDRAAMKKEFEASVAQTVGTTRIADEVRTGIAAYLEAFPELNDPDSDARTKLQAAFNKLTRRGAPEGAATELTAMENAFGDLKPKGRRKEPETHQETGGSGDEDHSRGGSDAAWAKSLTAAEKKHYQKKIDQGIYKGPTDKNLLAETKIIRERRSAMH